MVSSKRPDRSAIGALLDRRSAGPLIQSPDQAAPGVARFPTWVRSVPVCGDCAVDHDYWGDPKPREPHRCLQSRAWGTTDRPDHRNQGRLSYETSPVFLTMTSKRPCSRIV